MLRIQILKCIPDGDDEGKVMDAIVCNGLIARMDVAIGLAVQGDVEFYVAHNSQQTKVSVETSAQGRLFLKTDPNTSISDNLGAVCRASERMKNALGAFGWGPSKRRGPPTILTGGPGVRSPAGPAKR